MNFYNFLLLLWVIFALLDPDPDLDSEYGSGSGSTDSIEYGSNTDADPVPDPDPQPWLLVTLPGTSTVLRYLLVSTIFFRDLSKCDSLKNKVNFCWHL